MTEGGPLDLLGIDEDGYLVVFELKRGTLYRETVAQVLDYASYLAELTSELLADHISACSGMHGIEKIEDFEKWYESNFSQYPERYAESPRMVLVGLGVDDRTKRMVNYLADRDINISLIVFQAFEREGKTFLAKRVEVEDKSTESGVQRKYTKSENQKNLNVLAEKVGVTNLLKSMVDFFRDGLKNSVYNQFVLRTGYSYGLREYTKGGDPTYRVYFGLYLDERKPGSVGIYFQKRAYDSASSSFEKLISKDVLKKADSNWYFLGSNVTLDEWDSLKDTYKNFYLIWSLDGKR